MPELEKNLTTFQNQTRLNDLCKNTYFTLLWKIILWKLKRNFILNETKNENVTEFERKCKNIYCSSLFLIQFTYHYLKIKFEIISNWLAGRITGFETTVCSDQPFRQDLRKSYCKISSCKITNEKLHPCFSSFVWKEGQQDPNVANLENMFPLHQECKSFCEFWLRAEIFSSVHI